MSHPFLEALHLDPGDDTAWLAMADWFEEQGDRRSELIRLTVELRRESAGPRRRSREARLQNLLALEVEPCMPVLVNSLGMELVLIPPGRFLMGSPFSEAYHSSDEGPVHEISITRPFYLGRFPVTQAEYRTLTGQCPSQFAPEGRLPYYRLHEPPTDRFPVDSIDHEDALHWCEQLSRMPAESAAGRVYRLPSEAEWEYACRAGTSTVFHVGDSLSSRQANFDGNYPYGGAPLDVYLKRPCPVGSYTPNAFGLHDMHGNVWEWCADWYDEHYYAYSPRIDPPGPAGGESRVLRGGSWIDASWHCRAADRSHREALHYVGFRVAMTLSE